MMKYKSKLKII